MARTAVLSGAEGALRNALAERLTREGLEITTELPDRFDVLVHAVVAPGPASFVGVDPGAWFAEVMAALTPAFSAVRTAAPALRGSVDGRIVLIGAGWFPADRPYSSAADAVSGALVALTKTLARDLGPSGIMVNQVVVDPADPADPVAVAATVGYLCRPDAGAVVGQLLTVGRGGPLRP